MLKVLLSMPPELNQTASTNKNGERASSSSNTVLWDHSEGHGGKRRTFVSVLENWTISMLCVCVCSRARIRKLHFNCAYALSKLH